VATPLLLCLVCVELSDVVFAFDSVPAVRNSTEFPLYFYAMHDHVCLYLNGLHEDYILLFFVSIDHNYIHS
jgi:tellurite resistance protein TerC